MGIERLKGRHVEARYVLGGGVLIGSGQVWVLARGLDESTVNRLWSGIHEQGVADLETLAEIASSGSHTAPDLAVAVAVEGPMRTLVRGAGVAQESGAAITLGFGTAGPGGPERPFLGGVVSAASAVLSPRAAKAVPTLPRFGESNVAQGASLIDGVPAAILAARGPDGAPPQMSRIARRHEPARESTGERTGEWAPEAAEELPAPATLADTPEPHASASESTTARLARIASESVSDAPAPVALVEPQPQPAPAPVPDPVAAPASVPTSVPAQAQGGPVTLDHDGATIHRSAPAQPHLQAQVPVTVPALLCAQGHASPPNSTHCRVCRAPLAPQQPRDISRPVLGGLRLHTGEVVPLDRGIVIGRRPAPLPGGSDWPHLVHLGKDYSFVSRVHLAIELHGWDVVARDLDSRGGTTLTPAQGQPVRMQPGQGYLLGPGTVLDLAGAYQVRMETEVGLP